MAVRKINHNRRIRSKTSTTLSKVDFGDIIEFSYNVKNVYDKKPLVFVLSQKGKILNGINIGYVKEYIIEKLIEETNPKKLKTWPLVDNAFRTYKKSNVKMIKLIEYETLPQRKLRLLKERTNED
tara:strand:+ start:657 stop:1031 length:375 start_codon:yes stop_codon:yes gene_type:complete